MTGVEEGRATKYGEWGTRGEGGGGVIRNSTDNSVGKYERKGKTSITMMVTRLTSRRRLRGRT